LKVWQLENQGATLSAYEDELRSIQTFAALKPSYKVLIYIGVNFQGTSLAALSGEITTHLSLLKIYAKGAIQQRQLIAAVEWFCGYYKPALVKFFPALLKQLFDEEVVEEEVFLGWYQDNLNNGYSIPLVDDETLETLKATARPFYDWLQEAEEEDDSDSDGG
jgi:hypothetical protein